MNQPMSRLKALVRPIYSRIANKVHDLLYGPRRYRYLFSAIRETRARRIMEIGTWHGNRAMQMIREAQRLNPGAQVEYYGFDFFEDLDSALYTEEISKWPVSEKQVIQKLEATGAKVTLFKGNTRDTLPQAVASLPAMDLVFIDGGHSRETIQNDWDGARKLMHEKTVVLFDDYWRTNEKDGAKPVVDAIDTNEYDVTVLPVTDRFEHETFGTLTINFARVTRR